MERLFVVMCMAVLALNGCFVTNVARSAMDVSNKAITSLTEKSGNDTLKKAGSVAVSTQNAAMDIADPKGAAKKTPAAAKKESTAPTAKAPTAVKKVKAADPKMTAPKEPNKASM